ncbi:MAG: hypothetical protein K1X79_06805 [Oligoflexia bacterium]|nr:hypothetical protein [Oligoflexia bacterium]
MEHVALWRLSTDILLLLSLGFLCFQFARSPRINSQLRVVRELEAALRVLVREADGAGRSLNDQLMRRQQAIEKAVIDAELAEQRIQRVLTRSEAMEKRSTDDHETSQEIKSRSPREQFTETEALEDMPIRKASARPTTRARLREEIEVTQTPVQEPSEPRWGKVNIYGEPIGESAPPQATQARPKSGPAAAYGMKRPTTPTRAASISKPASIESAAQSIDEIYASAEELLRAGNGLATVASRTSLPIEEIRALSQMIIGERAVAAAKSSAVPEPVVDDHDPRLGVMANMKRQTITV